MADLEERECRICRGEDEPDRPLLHPCRCSGSIKYTHEDCLVNWLAQSGSTRCELCNHSFRFEPLYQPNTPTALPTREFLVGVLALMKKALRTVARIALVFTVWLFLLPVGTCWTWYALFINSPSQLPALLASRVSSGIVTDAFYGFLLSAGIVFIFLGVSSLREYIRHFPQDAVDANDEQGADMFLDDDALMPDEIEDYDSDDNAHPLLEDLDFDALQNVQMAIGNDEPAHPGDLFPRNLLREPVHLQAGVDEPLNDEVLDEVDELVRDTIDDFAGADDSDVGIVEADRMLIDDSDDDGGATYTPHAGDIERHAVAQFHPGNAGEHHDGSESEYLEDEHFPGEPVNAAILDDDIGDDVEDLDDMNNDDLGENEDQDGRGDGGALFGLFELDPDEVPLEEVVGLRGHIRHLFDNACTVLFSNAVFLGVFTLIPLLIGRLTLRLFSMKSFPLSFVLSSDDGSVLSWGMWSLLQSSVGSMPSQLLHAVHNASEFLSRNVSSESVVLNIGAYDSRHTTTANSFKELNVGLSWSDSLISGPGSSPVPSRIPSPSPPPLKADQPLVSYVDNFLIVLLGYGMIALIAVAYIGVMSMLRRRYPRLDSPVTRQIARMLRYVATFVKIVVLILFEFGIFPLGCGWWLDICTLDILGGSLQSRLAYCHDSPWTCTGIHWIMGIIYMVHISLFISLLREVVRPELLWFLRNPDDPEFHPFRELVEKPLSRHARRMCISVVIYVPLIIALVYVPGQLCLKLLPSVFPFRSEDFSHILIDVPFGNLLVGPLIRLLYFGRPDVSLQKVVAAWVHWVSTMLGVAHLVVKEDDDMNAEVAGPGEGVADARAIAVGLRGGGPLQRLFGEDELDVLDGEVVAENDVYASNEDVDAFEEGAVEERGWIHLRAAVMIFAAWLTLTIVQSALLSIPTVVGRWLMGAVGLPVRHDLHPFLLGLNILLGCISGVFKLAKYMQTLGTVTILSMGLPYVLIAAKGAVILVIWLGAIPLATGLLFELTLMPIRVAHNETPYFCMHQDWAMGLLLLKVWACIAMTGGLGVKWRERVLRAREGDILGLDQHFGRSMREVFLPLLVSVLTALSVPYSFARGLLPMLGVTRWVSNLVYRYAYLVIAWVYCGMETMRYSISMLRELHDSIRDDKYLVGKRLYNFMEAADITTSDLRADDDDYGRANQQGAGDADANN